MSSDYVKQLEEENYKLKMRLEAAILENEKNRESLETLQKQIYVLEGDRRLMMKEITQKDTQLASLNETIKYHLPRN